MDDYFKFNGVFSTSKDLYLKAYTPILKPAKKKSFISIPGRHGSVSNNDNTLQDVIISCDVSLVGLDEVDVLRKAGTISNWLSTRGKLEFCDMPHKYYMGELIGEVGIKQNRILGDFNLTFRCDPFKYGATRTEPLGAITTFTNRASKESAGVITLVISENTSIVKVTSLNTGEVVSILHDFVVGDRVEINLTNESISKNGYFINRYLAIESDYFNIVPGENKLAISPGVSSANIVYTERWL